MKEFFKDLFDYGHNVNQQLAEVFIANHGKASEKSVKLFNHILNAHHIWNSRIDTIPSSFEVWGDHPADDWLLIENSNHKNTLLILENYDLISQVNYLRKGQAFTNSIRDILFHIINHSTYHRGQIATDFRLTGIEPLVSDYIFHKR